MAKCPICEGEGLLEGYSEGNMAHVLLCPNCGGTGRCLDPEEFRLGPKKEETKEQEQ